MVTDHGGAIYEHLEYTPYGELWVDHAANTAGENPTPFRFTGKELDPETGLYYYGARYLDPKTSRWISADPAMTDGSYIPSAPIDDEAKKRNQNLPGMGGVFNYVAMHVYHYAGNNPVVMRDPDGNYVINNVAPGSINVRREVSSTFLLIPPVAQIYRKVNGFNILIVVAPKQFEGQITPNNDDIELDPGLTAALNTALKDRANSKITASVNKMKNGKYEVNVTVEIKGQKPVTATVAFAEKDEVLKSNGEINEGKVREIANETINIARNTVAKTNNIDEVR